MEYLLLIYEDEKRWANMPQAEQERELAGYRAFGKEFAAGIKAGKALQPTSTATSVRVRDGRRLSTDGPFAETREQLGGFYLVEARDLDEAIVMAAKIPGAKAGSIEVRPIMTFS
ncbi:MAG TPA: YciI family protein [Gemmatimonadaceae bacterium]